MSRLLFRSVALVPGHQSTWVESALSWEPDALVMDLDGLVHPSRQEDARRQVARRLADGNVSPSLLVRISAEASPEDWAVVSAPSLTGVVLSGAEDAKQIVLADNRLQDIERDHNLVSDSLALLLYLNTGKGLWRIAELAAASPRVTGVVLGMGDAALDLTGFKEPSYLYRSPVPRYSSTLTVFSRTVYLAAALGVQRLVSLGTSMAPGHVDSGILERGAGLAASLGFTGALTLHKEGVLASRKAFVSES